MTDGVFKPAARASTREGGSRRRSRLLVVGKLTALLGLPLLVLFAIFAAGVYCGVTRADRVVELEQRWLGIEPPAGRLLKASDSDAEGEGGADQPPEPPEPEPRADAQASEPEPAVAQEPAAVEQPEPSIQTDRSVGALEPAKAEPVGAELRSRFEEPKRVRVKFMVDPALVVARADWLSYIADLFEATRVSYERLFGIELHLQGVVVWEDAVGADASTLLSDLATRNRDGADLLLGLLARAQPPDFTPARWDADLTGDHALVFADLQRPDRYYRNLLRALALLFGAEPALDAEARQLGSFMSDNALASDGAPVIDPDNRGKVIINKRRPIAAPPAEPGVEPLGEPAPSEVESEI